VTPRALKFVPLAKIEDHFRLGWMVMFPNAPMHHHHYGVEMKWICECEVPGGFRPRVNRVALREYSSSQIGDRHERDAGRQFEGTAQVDN